MAKGTWCNDIDRKYKDLKLKVPVKEKKGSDTSTRGRTDCFEHLEGRSKDTTLRRAQTHDLPIICEIYLKNKQKEGE